RGRHSSARLATPLSPSSTLAAMSVVSWTPNEAWLFAELARRVLVASLDGRAPVRAGDGFAMAAAASEDTITLALTIDATNATLALRPALDDQDRWRDGWAIELER